MCADLSTLFIVCAGLVAGALHVLSGPDHLAAVAPLAADSTRSRWRAGFSWGIGHTGGVLAVGLLAVLLRGMLPLDGISSWSERLVGVALIGVGLWSGHRLFCTRGHVHRHVHGGVPHSHVHFHGTGARSHDWSYKTTCDNDLTLHEYKVKLTWDAFVNPAGCDEENTGILVFKCA